MEKQTLAQLNAALTVATQATQEKAQTDATTGTLTSTGGTSSSDAFDNLIKDLRDSDDVKRRRSRSQLALLGQSAVKPLLKEVAAHFGKNKEEDYKTRLGIATAFKLMKQPITLDDTDAYWLAGLVKIERQRDSLQYGGVSHEFGKRQFGQKLLQRAGARFL